MEDVQAELQRFKKDTAYYQAHYEELLEQYPEQWVAIYDEQVVGASPDFDQLLDDLNTKGVPSGRGLIEHLTSKDYFIHFTEEDNKYVQAKVDEMWERWWGPSVVPLNVKAE